MRSKSSLEAGISYTELLVAVALLATLGAVALPQYRQANVYSDYAQALDNFGQIKVALEAYYTDAGEFPESDQGVTLHDTFGRRSIHRITSPIAYIPSIPTSPFADNFGTVGKSETSLLYERSYLYDPSTYDPNYVSDFHSYVYGSTLAPGQTAYTQSKWMLKSVGPDGIDDRSGSAPGYGALARVYDPTNGLVSRGDVVWFTNLQASQPMVTDVRSDWQQFQ